MHAQSNASQEDIEIKLLVEAIFLKYGYDFHDYAEASLRRRILRARSRFGCTSLGELQARVLNDKAFFAELLSELTVTVSEMFRDPAVYKTLAEDVLPVLATYPSIRIWHAGCSSGEEVYSMAILLKEEGLLDRSTLYATDINPLALQRAKAGVFSAADVQQATANYQKAGRRKTFSDYYAADYGSAVMDRSLRERVVFAEHNLATDEVFSEVHLVLCRNVLIYFNKPVQNRALRLFNDSLLFKGFLCLGTKESLKFTEYEGLFTEMPAGMRVYQKSGSN